MRLAINVTRLRRKAGLNERLHIQPRRRRCNQGAPIPAELLPVLFDPFRYGDTGQRKPKSYGLGLYISREIVAAHGGTTDVSSSREAGTTFTVRLPEAPPHSHRLH
jgi:signal transduction histidine kinase